MWWEGLLKPSHFKISRFYFFIMMTKQLSETKTKQSNSVQWYPGHIAKWDRELLDALKKVDVVVEVLDARMPLLSRHPELNHRLDRKPIITVLNKAELADPAITEAWQTWFKRFGCGATVLFDAHEGAKYRNKLIQTIVNAGAEAVEKWQAKGLKARPVRVMVVGMPNVGKSSIINCLVGKKKVQTGHKAGVTRTSQWIRIHSQVDLLDSPGIIPPKLESDEQGHWLALVSSLGEAAFDEEIVALFVLQALQQRYPQEFRHHLGFALDNTDPWTLEQLGVQKLLLKQGGVPDAKRAAQLLLRELRHGSLGKLSFEEPPV
jgi:ribosome biogenesis GTPase A